MNLLLLEGMNYALESMICTIIGGNELSYNWRAWTMQKLEGMNCTIIGGNEIPYNLRAGGILIYSVGQLGKQVFLLSFWEVSQGTHFIDVEFI